MKIYVLSLVTLFLFVSCSSHETYTAGDGSEQYEVTCGAKSGCYKDAANLCGGKYQVIDTAKDGKLFTMQVKCGEISTEVTKDKKKKKKWKKKYKKLKKKKSY